MPARPAGCRPAYTRSTRGTGWRTPRWNTAEIREGWVFSGRRRSSLHRWSRSANRRTVLRYSERDRTTHLIDDIPRDPPPACCGAVGACRANIRHNPRRHSVLGRTRGRIGGPLLQFGKVQRARQGRQVDSQLGRSGDGLGFHRGRPPVRPQAEGLTACFPDGLPAHRRPGVLRPLPDWQEGGHCGLP